MYCICIIHMKDKFINQSQLYIIKLVVTLFKKITMIKLKFILTSQNMTFNRSFSDLYALLYCRDLYFNKIVSWLD